jgi:DNA-binding response OmpR family regulator
VARVLVIDDEDDVLLLCRVNLQHAGHEVLEALDGDRGLELARSGRPDIVVLDLMLPSIDGYEVLAALRDDDRTRHLPVLVLTAKAQIEDELRSWRAGAAEFLTKPFPPQTLVEALERVVAASQDEREARRHDALRELTGSADGA